MPEVVHSTPSDESPLVDVDSEHIGTVPSSFPNQDIQTFTQADREQKESDAVARREQAEEEAQKAEKKAKDAAAKAEKKAKEAADKTKKQFNDLKDLAQKNRSNPVVLGNVVVVGALAAVFGTRVYKRWQVEGFDWQFAGITAGAIGAFATADYFVSR